MQPRNWTPPPRPPRPAAAPAPAPADAQAASPRAHWGIAEHFASFILYMLFFGFLGIVFRSRFPVDLGLFFFVTNDDLREWVLRKLGIRLVPGTLGPPLVEAFIWLSAASVLFARWKGSAPAWLSSWLPPPDASWPGLAFVALCCAALTVVSTAAVRKLLPRFGIVLDPNSLRATLAMGLIGFAILGLVMLLLFDLSHLPIFSDLRFRN